MKKTFIAFAMVALCLVMRAEIVTISHSLPNPKAPFVEVTADQTIEVLTVTDAGSVWWEAPGLPGDGGINVAPSYQKITGRIIFRGPGKLALRSTGGTALATFQILPERVDPTKTAIVYPGSNNTSVVSMICSTNLLNWYPATNGIYSGDVAKFFRINVESPPK